MTHSERALADFTPNSRDFLENLLYFGVDDVQIIPPKEERSFRVLHKSFASQGFIEGGITQSCGG